MEGREHIGEPIVSFYFYIPKFTRASFMLIHYIFDRRFVVLHELLLVISSDVLKLLLMHPVVVFTPSLLPLIFI